MEYLKDETYYNDLYDLHTVESCLKYIRYWEQKAEMSNKMAGDGGKELPRKLFKFLCEMQLYSYKGERFRDKKNTIADWIQRDRQLEELFRTAPPSEVKCKNCRRVLPVFDKWLDWGLEGQPDKVVFVFICDDCKTHRTIYSTGEEEPSKSFLCSKCGSQAHLGVKRSEATNEITHWITSCSTCGFKEEEINDLKERELERSKQNRCDKELLVRYRSEFCLSDEKGGEYILSAAKIEAATNRMDYEKTHALELVKIAKLKKLKIADLKILLEKCMRAAGFTQLEFTQPDMGKFLVINFMVQDQNPDREEYSSCSQLKKAISATLADTNWRLMSDGLSYRLGILSGRLKAYEREADLIGLVEKG